MFEKLTSYLPKLENTQYGKWIIDTENDGSPEHPIQFPFVVYNQTVESFIQAVYQYWDEHQEFDLGNYREILEKDGIAWDSFAMTKANVSRLNGQTVLALIMGALRADRFCEGALLEFFENGSIAKWLTRLEEIDRENK